VFCLKEWIYRLHLGPFSLILH